MLHIPTPVTSIIEKTVQKIKHRKFQKGHKSGVHYLSENLTRISFSLLVQ